MLFSWSVGASGAADGSTGAVVAACGVDGELAEEFAGGGVDDAHLEVVDEDEDGGSVEVAAEGDVVEVAVEAQGDVAGVDAVAAYASLWGVGAAGGGFRAGVVGGGGCGVVRQ